MSVGSITNANMNASYTKQLEQKKKSAQVMALSGSGMATSACALHFLKAPLAVKHPGIVFAGSILGLLGTVFGFSQAAKIEKELKKYDTQEPQQMYLHANNDNIELSKKPKMSYEEAKFVISMCVNPIAPNTLFYLPRLEEAKEAYRYYQEKTV